MFRDLLDLRERSTHISAVRKHPEWAKLVNQTAFLSSNSSASRRCWHADNNLWAVPKCRVCVTNDCVWNKEKGGSYRPTCGTECTKVDTQRYDNIKHTNNKKYGGDSPYSSKEVLRRRDDTIKRRYGVDNISQLDSVKHLRNGNAVKSKNSNIHKRKLIQGMIDNGDSQSEIGKKLEICQPRVSKLLNRLNMTTIKQQGSTDQTELIEFIRELVPTTTILENDRTTMQPRELDIVLPEYNLAFEYNGVYWHSECISGSRDAHIHKTEECMKLGIQLIHIFSNEWTYQRDIVESRIRSIIGHTNRIYARKCAVVKLTSIEAKTFCDKYHLQTGRYAKYNYGLIYEDELVCVATLSPHKTHQYELIRLCTKSGYTIVGGASKLLAAFIREYQPNEVMSFADRRWSTGNVYRALGFELVYNTKPNYWYFDMKGNTNILHSRQRFQKHKLNQILPSFSNDLSEWDNMKNNDFSRIWDCGSSKWVLRL